MKVEKLPNDEFVTLDDAVVKVKKTGNIVEVMASTRAYIPGQVIQKLDKDHYVRVKDIDRDTGEIIGEVREYVHNESRASDMRSVARSIGNLRDLINCNCVYPDRLKWITGTYKQRDNPDQEPVPMTDTVRLYKDFEKFMKKVRYHYGKGVEYIVAMEPQGSGSWHFHCILIFPGKAPYMPNDKVCDMWGQGFTSTKGVDAFGSVDNLGAYLSAYLGDMALDDVYKNRVATHGEVKTVDGKKYVKGARLCLYPAGFQLYRSSRGVKRPVVERKSWRAAQKDVQGLQMTYEKTRKLTDDETGFENILNYKYFNKKVIDKSENS